MSPILLSPVCIFPCGQICHTIYSSAILTAKLLFVHNTFALPWPISFPALRLTFGLKNFPFSLVQAATVPSPSPKSYRENNPSLSWLRQATHFELSFTDMTPPSPFLIPAPIICSISRWGFRSAMMESVSVALVKTLSRCPVGWHCWLPGLQHTSWLMIRVNEEHDDFSIQLLISNW